MTIKVAECDAMAYRSGSRPIAFLFLENDGTP